MRITLVIAALTRGGAERVMTGLANFWAERGDQVTVLTFDHGATPSYFLAPAANHRSLGLAATSHNVFQGLYRNLGRVRRLRCAIRDSHPDVVICFIDVTNVQTLVATRGLGIPVIVSERVHPSLSNIGPIWATLRRVTYPLADALVCQTQPAVAWFESRMKVKGYVIPNALTIPPRQVPSSRRDRQVTRRVVTGMGRLVPQKGFDILLRAFSTVSARHPEWILRIIGTGPLRQELESTTQALGIGERVTFTGEVADPFSLLEDSDLFVLSSRFEGFANALCEAMALGLAVISFDCPSGPAEIIRNGEDGVLVRAEDEAALAVAMDHLMRDEQERERLAARAPEVLKRFSPDRIMPMWDRLLCELNIPRPG